MLKVFQCQTYFTFKFRVALVFGAFYITCLGGNLVAAQPVNLAWDPNTEPNVAGYKLYYKVGGNQVFDGTGALEGDSPIDVGDATTASVSGLDPTKVTCFAVTAYDSAGYESSYSNEVCSSEGGVPPTGSTCTDADGDGFFTEGGGCGPADCNDSSTTFHPDAAEIPYNGLDENCNGLADDNDLDGDGYPLANDCDDQNVAVNPGVAEVCDDRFDNNCNGLIDAEEGSCGPVCTDADNDGYFVEGGYCGPVDPDDNNARLYPGAPAAEPEMGTAAIDNIWQTLTMTGAFGAPVVIVGPPGVEDLEAGVVRIIRVGSSSFDIRFQEWGANLDDLHLPETVAYMVFEKGRHLMPDGSIWEVGTFDLGGTAAPMEIAFSEPFADVPKLFLTLQSYNEAQPVTVRASNVTSSGFVASLFEEEGRMDGHGTESVGYLAVYSPNGSGTVKMNGQDVPYQLGQQSVDSNFTKVLNMALRVEEEQSYDSEVDHASEEIALLWVDGDLFAQDVSCQDMDPAALRCDLADSDGDGYADSIDAFPADPNSWEAEPAPPVDNQPPVVSVVEPGYGAIVSGTIPVKVSASDDTAVNRVELLVNSSLYDTDTVAPYNFDLDTAAYENSGLEILARAYDPAGNEGVSGVIALYPANGNGAGLAPEVTLLSPQPNDRIGRRLIVEATASDDVSVEKIEFYVDGELKKVRYSGYLRTALFTRRLAGGEHVLTIKAYDADGNVGQASVTIEF